MHRATTDDLTWPGRNSTPNSSNRTARHRRFLFWTPLAFVLFLPTFAPDAFAQSCPSNQWQIWMQSVSSPEEGDNLLVHVNRNGQQAGAMEVEVQISYVGTAPGFDVFDSTLPSDHTITISSGQSSGGLSLGTTDNAVVSGDVEIKAEVKTSTSYCVPDTTDRPASATGTVTDNDTYSLFVELGTDQASSVTEGDSIQLRLKRCVIAEDDSVVCTDPTTTAGVRANAKRMPLYHDTVGDYFATLPSSLRFAKDVIQADLTIATIDDNVVEPNPNGSIKVRTEDPDSGRSDQSVSVAVVDNDRICPVGQSAIWVGSVDTHAAEGATFSVVLKRDGPEDEEPPEVSVTLNHAGTEPDFNVFDFDLPATFDVAMGKDAGFLTLQSLNNNIVNSKINITAELETADHYCVPDSTSRPRSKSGGITDNDTYSVFVELASGQASSINEGDSIDLALKRCVLAEDDSVVCTDPTDAGVRAPAQTTSVFYDTDGNYFGTLPDSVDFARGSITTGLTLSSIDDSIHEAKQTGSITIRTKSNPNNLHTDQSVSVEVADDDPVQLSLVMSESVTEGESVDLTVTRSSSEVYRAIDIDATIGYHTKMFPSASPPNVTQTFEFAKNETSKTISIATDDDEINEGDGMLEARVVLPRGYASSARDGWARIVDDDIPTLTLGVSSDNVTEGDSVDWTLSRDKYFESQIIARPAWEAVHYFVPPSPDRIGGSTANGVTQTEAYGFVPAGKPSITWTEEAFGLSCVVCTDIVGPLGGYMRRRILPFPEDTYEGRPKTNDQTFLPRYTVSNTDWVTVTIYNSAPGVRITRNHEEVDEGDGASFTLTRFGGRQIARESAMRINIDVSETGDFLDSSGGSRVVTFPLLSETVSFTLDTDDDSTYELDGVVTAALQAGANTGLTEDTYEFRTIQDTDGSYDHTASISVLDNDSPPDLTVTGGSAPESEQEVAFTFSLSEAATVPASVDYATTSANSDTATPNTDYDSSTGTLSFAVGDKTKNLNIAITDDALDEGDESFTLSLSNPSHLNLANTGAGATIEDDDDRGVTVSSSSLTVPEGGTGSYTIVLDSQPTGRVTITPSLSGSSDVTLTPSSLSFTSSNWSTAQTVTVSAAQDDDKLDDAATISHAVTGADYASETAGGVAVTVDDDETASTGVALSLDTASVGEDQGATTITVTGTLDAAVLTSDAAVAVTVGHGSDSATSGTDYAGVPGFTLTIKSGQPSGTATFSLSPTDDDIDEADESLTVSGTAPGLKVSGTSVTILDDDARGVTLSTSAVNVAEGSSATYTVVLDSEPTGAVTVTPSVTGSTDVTLKPASLGFTASNWDTKQTVTVSAAEDADAEDDTATISHSVSGADYASETAGGVAVTVDDDETASTGVALSLDTASVGEDQGATTITVTGTLDAAVLTSDAAVAVTVGHGSDSATSGTDYAGVPGFTLTIKSGQPSGTATFSLSPTDDDIDEADESLTVSGTAPDLKVSGTSVTILDDDARGVTLSTSAVNVAEGSSATYTVVLDSEPTGAVTVTPSVTGSTDVTLKPASLGFTASNWDTKQTVTVSAAEDADAEDDTATISHSVSGADYASETAGGVAVTVDDDETASTGVALSLDTASVGEDGGATTITVTGTLDAAVLTSDAAVAVTVGQGSDSATSGTDYAGVPGFTLTIKSGQPSGTATFSLSPTDDDIDEADESLTVSGTAPGLKVSGTSVTILDDDARGVTLSTSAVNVAEGSSATYTVVLDSEPTGAVTVTPSVTGSTDVTLKPASLGFTASNWDTKQTVTVSAAEDADAEDDTATISHSVSGADYASETAGGVAVTVDDDETASTGVALSLDTASVGEDQGATTITVTGTLDAAVLTSDAAVAVTVGHGSDSATSGTDYAGVPGFTLTIKSGQPSGTATFSLSPTDDDIDEADESLTVSGTAPDLKVSGTSVTILDDDARGVTLSTSAVNVAEGSSATYTVVLDSEPTGAVTVTPSVTGSTDVTLKPASLGFTASNWDTKQTVTVSAAEDADAEDDTATISHSVSGADYASETAGGVAVTVDDDETASTGVALSLDTASVGEDQGATTITVTGTLDAAVLTSDAAVAVTVGHGSDSATSGTDYAGVPGFTLTIKSGQPSGTATFSLSPTDDDIDEADESLTVSGTAPDLKVSGTSVTILDDDARGVTLSTSAVNVAEGSSATYTVVLDSEPTGAVTVTPSVTGSTDVTLKPASLGFTASNWDTKQTVTVSAAEDADAEDDTATISHSVSGADYASETAGGVAVTVDDDETASTGVALSLDTASVGEDGGATTITVTGTLDAAVLTSDAAVAVTVGQGSDSATSGTDYAGVPGFTLTIKSGQPSGTATFSLSPTDDDIDEADESLTVSGTAPGLKVSGTSVTILDDDARGVTLSTSAVNVAEGSSATYTVVLDSEPTGAVTVTPSVTGSTDVTLKPASLDFTASNWNTKQTVTVFAAEDADAVDESATLEHEVSGADYGEVSARSVTVDVSDNETASTRLITKPTAPLVAEDAGTVSISIEVSLNAAARDSDTTVTLKVGSAADSAIIGTDYDSVPDFTVIIEAGETKATGSFAFTPTDDDLDENNESVSVSASAAGTNLTTTVATIVIEDNDTRGVTLSKSALDVSEGSSATYTVVLDSEPTGAVTIAPSVTGSPDVTLSPPSLRFTSSNWSTAKTVTVSAAQDDDAEDDTASIAHDVSGADYASETAGGVSVTVNDDETASTGVTLSVNPSSVAEDAPPTTIRVTGTLNAAVSTSDTTLTVSVGQTSDSATSGTDYTGVSDFTLTIAAGQASGSATFSLSPTDDHVDEEAEFLAVSGRAKDLDVTSATITIQDNDQRGVAISQTDLDVDEGSTATYTVVLESEPTDTVTIIPRVSGSPDVSFSPANLSFTTDNWDTAHSVTVSAAQDADAEDDSAMVSHSIFGGDYGSETLGDVSVTVHDDETASTRVVLSVDTPVLGEGAGTTEINLTATLNQAARTTDTLIGVTVGHLSDSATSGADYADVPDFTLTIAAGEASSGATISLAPWDDDIDESDESLTISGATTDLRVAETSITLVDDDNRGVGVSTAALSVIEGSSNRYTIMLRSEPTGTVTITPTLAGSPDITLTPASLEFSADDWGTAQTVTVSAAEDEDAANDTANITHSVSGADYDSESAGDVSVTVEDNEIASSGVALSVDTAAVNEGDGPTRITVMATLNGAVRASDTVLTLSIGAASDTALGAAAAAQRDSSDPTVVVDYTGVSDFTLTIESGNADGSATFTFSPTDDFIDEDVESVSVLGTAADLEVIPTSVEIHDDDSRGVAVSTSTLTISEGESESYTLTLESAPMGDVNITPSLSGSPDVTFSPARLSFTPANWNTPHRVTVTAAEDADAEDESALISHDVSGADYDSETANDVSVLVDDRDTPASGLSLSVDVPSISEGAGATTITVTASLMGAVRTWDTTVEVSVGLDADPATAGVDYGGVPGFTVNIPGQATSGNATFSLTPIDDHIDEDAESLSVTGTATDIEVTAASITIDDDDHRGVLVSTTTLRLVEGSSASYTVALNSQPTGTVTVAPSLAGSPDIRIEPASLRFLPENWRTAQTITVSGAEDEDAVDDSGNIAHSVSGADYDSETASDVSVRVEDDETASSGVVLSLDTSAVDEGAGTASITVTATLNAAARASDTLVGVSIGDPSDTATDGVDYTSVAEFNVRIAQGDTQGSATFTFSPLDDKAHEGIESVSVAGSAGELTVTDTSLQINDNDTPSSLVALSIDTRDLEEGAGPTNVTIAGTLDGAPRTTDILVTISVGEASDTATDGIDYTSVAEFTLTINSGETSGSATFSLSPTDDDIDEADESLTVSGTAPDLKISGTSVTILDDDTRGVTLSTSAVNVAEGSSATYGVVLGSEPTGAVTVTPSVTGSTDVTFAPMSLSFTASNWNTAKTVTVSAAEDADAEDDTATISHSVSGADYASETAGGVAVTVDDDETASTGVALSLDTDSVGEDEGTTTITVTGTLEAAVLASDTPVTVTVGQGSDSATSGTDYAVVPGFTLTIKSGQKSGTATFSLAPIDDDVDEEDESLSISATAPDLSVTGSSIAIHDNDQRGVKLSTLTLEIAEGSTATYTLVLESEPTDNVTVTPVVSGSPDVTIDPATLSFATSNWDSERTVTVWAASDRDAEDENAAIAHTVSGGDYTLQPADRVQVRVVDSGPQPRVLTLSLDKTSLAEGDDPTRVRVTGALDLAAPDTGIKATVSIGADRDSARSGVDYAEVRDFTIEFDAGESLGTAEFLMEPIDDDLDEAVELVTITGTTNVQGVEAQNAQIEIIDDDHRGVRVEPKTLVVAAGGSATYSLVLTSQPADRVVLRPLLSEGSEISCDPEEVHFTPEDWHEPQVVTIRLEADSKGGVVMVEHTASGGDYGSTKPEAVEVSKLLPLDVLLSVEPARVAEDGGTTNITVTAAHNGAPRTEDITLRVSVGTGADGASEGGDYAPVDDLTLLIAAGETQGRVSFDLSPLDDHDDETDESLSLTGTTDASLVFIKGTQITIADDDEYIDYSAFRADAWLLRFGRTAGDQVLQAIRGRLSASREFSTDLSLRAWNGDALSPPRAGTGPGPGPSGFAGSVQSDHPHGPRPVQAPRTAPGMPGTLSEADPRSHRASGAHHPPNLGDLLASASFAVNSGSPDTGFGALWGHGATSRFDGQAGDASFHGDVRTALIGGDWMLGHGLAGLVVSHSFGEGSFMAGGQSGDLESRLTGVYPWASFAVNERVTLTGVLGYGEGTLELKPDNTEGIETDTRLAMAAADLRGVLITPSGESGLELAVRSDVLLVNTEMDAAENVFGGIQGADAGATRLRLGVEGRWHGIELGGGDLVPSLEVAVRHDGGDADTGWGTDLGAAFDWSNSGLGLAAQLRVRGLITHEADGFEERGLSASLIWDPDPASELGPGFSLNQTIGAPATGGASALLDNDATTALPGHGQYASVLDHHRTEARFGYGLNLLSGRLVGIPELGIAETVDGREVLIGWRMRRALVEATALSFGLHGARLDSLREGGGQGHSIGFELDWQKQASGPTGPGFGLGLRGERRTFYSRQSEHQLSVRFTGRW